MEFSRSINRMLHDEHMAIIRLLGRFGGYLRDHPDGLHAEYSESPKRK